MEMQKLIYLLTDAGIPFEVRDCYGTPQVCYPNANPTEMVCDAVCHPGSYGYEDGLLEIMGLVDTEKVGDDVEGWLTAADVFERIKAHYEAEQTAIIFTYDTLCSYYTAEYNEAMDFIIRNLPGVTIMDEDGRFVQVKADGKAVKTVRILSELVCIIENMTIKAVRDLLDE